MLIKNNAVKKNVARIIVAVALTIAATLGSGAVAEKTHSTRTKEKRLKTED